MKKEKTTIEELDVGLNMFVCEGEKRAYVNTIAIINEELGGKDE